jgi:hypothetical protein
MNLVALRIPLLEEVDDFAFENLGELLDLFHILV